MKITKLIWCLILLSSINVSARDKGHLVIIGGGTRSEVIMKKFIELAGGVDSKIIIIPMASEDTIESANAQIEELSSKYNCKNVDYIFCSKKTADEPANFAKLEGAKGIYFTGGDQVPLTRALLGTKLFDKMKEIYKNGGVIGGTSAGAAVMSKVMITGNELINKDTINIFKIIKKGNVQTIEGFGFLKSVIIDQHFIIRKRLNRLITVVLENPSLLGVGIDESTSIIVNPDDTFDVLGESLVVVCDARHSKNIKVDKNGNLAAENIEMHILKSGDKFSLKTKKVILSR
jgi:cyanophycinase